MDDLGPDGAPAPAPPTWRARATSVLRELIVLALLAMVGLVGFGWLRAPSLPEVAPGFTLTSVDGRTVSLEALRGAPVVLNFWATWCGPCRAELPGFAAFSRAHPELTVLGVAVDERAKVAAMAEAYDLPYDNVIASGDVVRAYGVEVFPTTVVLDADGRVSWAHSGVMLRPQLELIARLAR